MEIVLELLVSFKKRHLAITSKAEIKD